MKQRAAPLAAAPITCSAFAADWRRHQLVAVMVVYDWPARGSQRQIAAHLGVSEATISRDLRYLTEQQQANWKTTRDLLSATDGDRS